ncbi:unnamed protein product [Anisakis simplex]|uniref:Odorant-binding protein AgamOBP32 n=1 Tax=Anisakis simplex TaxID=6269 RepID=A0A0M3K1K9_ANISI|nr:unnamed protein product [Anisakis simplex]
MLSSEQFYGLPVSNLMPLSLGSVASVQVIKRPWTRSLVRAQGRCPIQSNACLRAQAGRHCRASNVPGDNCPMLIQRCDQILRGQQMGTSLFEYNLLRCLYGQIDNLQDQALLQCRAATSPRDVPPADCLAFIETCVVQLRGQPTNSNLYEVLFLRCVYGDLDQFFFTQTLSKR